MEIRATGLWASPSTLHLECQVSVRNGSHIYLKRVDVPIALIDPTTAALIWLNVEEELERASDDPIPGL